jgi:hypothetical protein
MTRKSKPPHSDPIEDIRQQVGTLTRIAALGLLQQVVTKDAKLGEKAVFLARLGFDTPTIAEMLGSKTTTIAPMLSRKRSKKEGI